MPDYERQARVHRALVESTEERFQAAVATAEALAFQQAAIKDAFAVGISAKVIREVAKLSRTRIYEIRDGK